MAHRSDTLRLWSPRILAVAVSLFLMLFALDSFAEGEVSLRSLPQFLIHTAPTLILLGVVAVAWRREWIRPDAAPSTSWRHSASEPARSSAWQGLGSMSPPARSGR